jgi:hypothetical protein
MKLKHNDKPEDFTRESSIEKKKKQNFRKTLNSLGYYLPCTAIRQYMREAGIEKF